MTFYKDMQLVAKDVLSKFKQGSIRLIQLTDGTGPADDPGSSSELFYDLNGTSRGLSLEFQQQGFVASTDFEVTASVIDGVAPTLDDFIEIDGIRYKVVRDMSVPTAGIKVAWKFIVRKGG